MPIKSSPGLLAATTGAAGAGATGLTADAGFSETGFELFSALAGLLEEAFTPLVFEPDLAFEALLPCSIPDLFVAMWDLVSML